ncbi:MAG: type 4b pilus protein PilO2 [Rhodanobacter sp.]
MLIETIGKRRYVFGLEWIFQTDTPLADLTAAGVVGSDEPVFAVTIGGESKAKRKAKKVRGPKKGETAIEPSAESVAMADAPGVIGYVVTAEAVRGATSAAAAMAGQGDGIYVAQLTTGEWWFTCIRNGVVVPSTDVIGTAELILDQVNSLRTGLSMDVFSGAPEVPGAIELDFDAALRRGAKSPSLRRVAAGSSPIVPILIAAAVLGTGWFGYRLMFPPTPHLTPEQQQAIARQAYIQSVQGVVKSLPTGAGWVSKAYATAVNDLPPYITGWTLDGVSCTPDNCMATYTVPTGAPFALSPLLERFGKAVTVLQDGHSVQVAMPVQVQAKPIDEAYLRSLRPASMPLLDWVGAVPLRMAGATVSGQLLARHLDQELGGAAAAMPPLTFEQVSLKGDRYMSGPLLDAVLIQGSHGDFVPVQVAWSFGNGTVPAGWRMTWERVHG